MTSRTIKGPILSRSSLCDFQNTFLSKDRALSPMDSLSFEGGDNVEIREKPLKFAATSTKKMSQIQVEYGKGLKDFLINKEKSQITRK